MRMKEGESEKREGCIVYINMGQFARVVMISIPWNSEEKDAAEYVDEDFFITNSEDSK